MTEDNNHSLAAPGTSNGAADANASATKKTLEDLLIDDDTLKTTFRDLADQEVKRPKSVGSSLRWPLVILALLIVAVISVVVGWYQFADLLTGQPGAGDQILVEKRMTVPERPQPQGVTPEGAPQVAPADLVAGQEAEQAGAEVTTDVVTAVASEVTLAGAEDTPSAVAVASAEAPARADEEVVETVLIAAEATVSEEQQEAAGSAAAAVAEPVYRVLVGPFISQRDLQRAAALLRERGFEPEQQHGAGTIDMIRLLEGIYPLAQAQQRLEEVRNEFASAFLLPDGERWALYIGSFSDRERARRQQRELAEAQIQVAQVDSQLAMEGPLLVVARSGLPAAEEVAAAINASGLRARIELER